MVEFALSMAFLTPLLLGTFNVSMNLGRNLQVTQLARNAGHMYVRWVDFSQTASQDLVVRLATGLNMTRTGGDATVILSQITVPTAADCTANNLTSAQCVNRDVPVIIHRIQFGNTALRGSNFGAAAVTRGADGSIAPLVYLQQTGARATNWTGVMTLQQGEVAFVSEVFARSSSINLGGGNAANGVYARAIY